MYYSKAWGERKKRESYFECSSLAALVIKPAAEKLQEKGRFCWAISFFFPRRKVKCRDGTVVPGARKCAKAGDRGDPLPSPPQKPHKSAFDTRRSLPNWVSV